MSSRKVPVVLAPFLLVSVLLISVHKLSEFPELTQGEFKFVPPQNIEHMVLGQQIAMADFYWISLIQDFSFCEHEMAKHRCVAQGWAFKIAMAISHLDPNFREAHLDSGIMLAVIVNDIEGASLFFDRAVELYPTDWTLQYAAAVQAITEEKDKVKAAKRFEAAARNGAPQWMYEAAHRFYAEAGDSSTALKLYEEMEQAGVISKEILQHMRDRLQNYPGP